MNLKELKQKAIDAKNKAISYSAEKLAESSLVIQLENELTTLIEKSKTTTFTNKETWVVKENKHYSIVIFAEKDSDFFKDALYALPVLTTKAFSQNISLKMAYSNIEWVDMQKYNIVSFPTLVVFHQEEIYKSLTGSENILGLVKSTNMDIKGSIDTIS